MTTLTVEIMLNSVWSWMCITQLRPLQYISSPLYIGASGSLLHYSLN